MSEYYDLILIILGFLVFISLFITAQGWIEKKMKNKASNTSGALVPSEEKILSGRRPNSSLSME
jgi:hypothetical protein